MATYYWVAPSANTWTSNNWSLTQNGVGSGTYPQIGDTALMWSPSSVQNCTLDINVDIAVLDMRPSYTGILTGSTYNFSTSGNLILRGGGTINMGSGDWSTNAGFFADGSGTHNVNSADVYLLGTHVVRTATGTFVFENLYCSGSYTCDGVGAADDISVQGILNITGTLSLGDAGDGALTMGADSDLQIPTAGTLTGRTGATGQIQWYSPQVGITDLRGILSNQLMTVYYPHTDAIWDPGTYDVRVDFVSSPSVNTDVNFQAGAYTWTGGLLQFRIGVTGEPHDNDMTVTLHSSTQMTFDDTTQLGFVSTIAGSDGDLTLNSNGADWIFASDVFQSITASTTLTWVKGSGLITVNGGVDQDLNFGGLSIEDIVINKTANTANFVNELTCESYTLTAGTAAFSDDATTWGVSITGGSQTMTGTNKTWLCNWLAVDAAVSAAIDVNDNNVTISGTGGISFIKNCTITMGQRTWTCNGDFSATNDTTILVRETSLLKLTGTGNFTANASTNQHYFYQIEIPVGATRTVLADSILHVTETTGTPKLTVDGTLTLTGVAILRRHANLYVSATGVINGIGTLQFFYPTAGYGFVTMDGTFSAAGLIFDMPVSGSLFQPAIYDSDVLVRQYAAGDFVWEPENGTYTINGDLTLQSTDVSSSTLTVNCSANNPIFVLKQNVDTVATGDFTWITGTGYIVFDGVGNHTIDFNDETLDDSYIQKDSSGKISLAANFSALSLTLGTGKFDANDYDVDITGNFHMGSGTGMECWCGAGSTWTINGDFDTRGVITDVFHAETSEIILVGTGDLNTYCSGWINNFHKLIISGTYTLVATSVACTIYSGSDGWLKIVNGGHLTSENALYVRGDNDFIIESGGQLTLNNNAYVIEPGAGYGIINGGIMDGTGALYLQGFVATSVAGAGNYSVDDIFIQPFPGKNDFTFGAGSWITKNIAFQASDILNIDMDTYDPTIDTNGNVTCNGDTDPLTIDRTGTSNDWSIEGDFTTVETSGTVTYVKGSANLIFDGSANSVYTDVASISLENVVINKSANAVILGSLLTCDSLKNLDGDFNAQTFAVNVGDVTWVVDTLLMGTSTWTCSGNFDVDVTGVSWSAGAATLVMTGTNKALNPRYLQPILNLDIDTGASITWTVTADGDYTSITGNLNIDGTFNLAAGTQIVILATADISATGIFGDGNGIVWLRGATLGDGIQTFEGLFNVDTLYVHPSAAAATDLLGVAGTYTATTGINILNSSSTTRTTAFGSGTYTFDTPLVTFSTSSTGTLFIDNTSGANLIFNGGIGQSTTSTGSREWLSGTGLITFTGTAPDALKALSMDLVGEWEDIEVIGGTYQLYENLTAESFTLTAGTWNSSTFDVTTSGDFEIVDGTFNAGSGNWSVSGNADFTTGGTFNRETSNFIFDGSSVTITGNDVNATLHKMHFTSSFNGILTGALVCQGNTGSLDVLVDGIIDLVGNLTVLANSDIVLGSSANVSGVGALDLISWNGQMTIDPSATFVIDHILVNNCLTGMILPARDYATDSIDLDVTLGAASGVFELQTGNTVFDNVNIANTGSINGDVTLTASSNFHITGNLDVEEQGAGQVQWSTNGDTYFSSAGDVSANTNNIYIGNLHILKNSGVILSSNMNVESLAITTGNFDANDYLVTVATGNTTWTTSDTIEMGAGNWYLGGNLDYSGLVGTLKQETSLLIMAGTSKTIESSNDSAHSLHNVNIDGTISSSGSLGDWIYSAGDLNINGTLTLSNQDWVLQTFGVAIWTNGLYVNSGGELTGTGTLRINRAQTGGGILSTVGDLTIANLEIAYPEEDGLFPAYDYSTVTNVRILQYNPGVGKLLWQSGPYTFNNLEITSVDGTDLPLEGRTLTPPASITVTGNAIFTANSTGDVIVYNNHASQDFDWIFQGNVTTTENSTGEIVWHKGSGNISFTGTDANQAIDLDVNGTLEELIVDKTAGQVTFTSNWVAESFMASNGALDFNAQTVQTSNNFVINTDATIVADADAMDGADITVGANFFVSNVTFNATSNWFLDVQGTSATAVTTAVAYSVADAGLEIDATAESNTDLLNTSNWNFVALAGAGVKKIQSLSTHGYPWCRMTNRSHRGFRPH